MEDRPTIWGIHAGSSGDAHNLFTNQGCVALGFEVPDLSTLPATRDAFKAAYSGWHPQTKPGAVPLLAGQLYRFVHEMRVGDLVAYPAKVDREIHLGRVAGPYSYDPTGLPSFAHRRRVEWARRVPRTSFSQGALYEIGSALSLFTIKNYADEFHALHAGQPATIVDTDEDNSVGTTAEEIEETTRDFILKRLARQLKGHPFATLVGHLLECMGYNARVSPPGADGGVDIVAHRDELGFEPPIIKVQVKSSEGASGDPEVSQLYGKVDQGEFGLFITLGTFTHPAKAFARNKSNLRLIDGAELVQLMLEHYEEFDSRYRGLLPLKRVYVPTVLEEAP